MGANVDLQGTNTRGGFQAMHVQDVEAYNVDGGTFTEGADRTRVLNTVVLNTIVGASLASNQITLPAGTYDIQWVAPAYHIDRHWSWLYDTTGAATLLKGGATYASDATGVANASIGQGRFALTAESVLEIRHRCTNGFATQGFGVATSVAGYDSIYTDVVIRKVG